MLLPAIAVVALVAIYPLARTVYEARQLGSLTLGLKVGQILGWRRLAPIAAVALIAASLAREWGRRGKPAETEDD